jgi:hypothetical protein
MELSLAIISLVGIESSLGFGLEWDGSDHHLVVEGSKCCANEGSHPEDPL